MAPRDIKPPLLQLGPGDSVTIKVYGQPDMDGTVYVSDDGTIPVALAGPVPVSGLSPSQASERIERALRDGNYLVDPHVTLKVTESHSRRVAVLGEVGKPGRYPIESDTSILDLLADAGGITVTGGDTLFLVRSDGAGNATRYTLSVQSLSRGDRSDRPPPLQGGDSVIVPAAAQFYIYGEVTAPGKFRVEPDMTVIEAIARAGGLTPRGSQRRVSIRRRNPDGSFTTTRAKLNEAIRADDVIRVNESIF